jgi:large repetitive protein
MLNRTFLIIAGIYCLCIVLGLYPHELMAQGRAGNNWVFGSTGQGIRFNFSDDSLADETINRQALGQGSSAVATDPDTGDLLFYTDGNQIYDNQDDPVGPVLGGNANGNQQVAISPVPGTPDQYYVFVNTGGDIVFYTVTMNTATGGLPEVANVSGPDATGVTGVSEAMAIVPNPSGDSYWLISQVPGTTAYEIVQITDAGPQPSVTSTATGAPPITATGISYSPTTGQLAVAGQGGVHILDFDPAAADPLSFDTAPQNTDAFDVAWSADGSKLYISGGNGGSVSQYDVTSSTLNPLASVASADGNFGLQLGPEGSVYHLYHTAGGEFQLGSITSADSTFNLVNYEQALLDGTDFGGRRFSQVSPAPDFDFAINVTPSGFCANTPTQITPSFPPGIPEPDSIVWDLGGQAFTGISPNISAEQATPVTATAYWGDETASASTTVATQQFELQVPLVQDTTICPGDSAVLNAEPQGSGGQQGGGGVGGGTGGTGGNYQYYWSTGETTSEITVGDAGVYWVLVTDPSSGCTAYAESNVKEYQIENQTYNVWYFGNGAGIDFNTLYDDPDDPDDGQITPIGDGAQNAPAGVAAVSDGNGDILFYTDGQTVYFKDRETGDHVALTDPNGAEVMISPSNESTMAGMVQVPGADGVYYIFTTTPVEEGSYELRYSIVDLKQRAVVSANNLLFTRSTERVAIFGGRGSNAVLVAHEYGSNTFRSYPISDQGIGDPVLSSVGSVHDLSDPAEAEGYMKFGGDSTGTVLAVALPDRVEIFNYDPESLQVTDPVTVDFSGFGVQPYGVEFFIDSLDNTVLLVSTDDGLYTSNIDRPVTEGSISITRDPDFSGAYGAIQRGPDGQIYLAQPGSSTLTAISVDPNTGDVSSDNTVELPNGTTSELGLPDYIDFGGNSFPDPNITVDNACVGNDINFAAQGRDNVIETYSWRILLSDGTAFGLPDSLRTSQNFTFAIDSMGLYTAEVTLSNPCDIDTVLTQEFEVGQGAEITLPESANLCNGSVTVSAIDPAQDDGTFTFEWVQVGAAGGGNIPAQNTVTLEEGGDYTVRVTNDEGCVSEGEIFIVDNRPPVNLPEDFTLCQNDTRQLDVEIPSPSDPGYEWVILDANDQTVATSNEPAIEVSEFTSTPGVFRYTVTVTDNSPEGCFVQDTVVVTIEEAPVITLTPTPTSACGTDDGSINLDLNGGDPSTLTFTWTDASGTVVSNDQNPTSLAAGTYDVTVTNEIGCSANGSTGIDDVNADFEIVSAGTTDSGCNDEDGIISVSLDDEGNAGVLPVTWTLTGTSSAGGISDELDFPIVGLSSGTYSLEVTSAGGCVQTRTDIEVLQNPDSVDFSFVEEPVNACGVNAQLAVDYNPTVNTWDFIWRDEAGNIIGPPDPRDANTVTVNTSGTYSVEVSDPTNLALCPSTQEISVTVNQPFDINIEQVEPDNSCETGERQLRVDFIPAEAASRDYIYNWSLNGNPIPEATRTITVDESGDYEVRVRERNSSCFATDLEPVVVSQPLSVNIFFGNTCDDGSAIPLFASVRTESTDSLSYRWFLPDGTRVQSSNPTGASDSLLVLSDMPEGEYRVEVQSASGCTAEGFASISRNPLPSLDLASTYTICTQDLDPEINSVTLEVGFAPEIYWTTPKGEFVNTTNVVADVAGTYIVEIVNQFGCTIVDSVEVIDDCTPRIVAPNAFRPAGVNQTFFVYTKYVAQEDFEVKIYNRWGELVYQSNSPDFQWDGTYNGKTAPLGTYPYVINYRSSTSDSGEVLEERGGVMIIR